METSHKILIVDDNPQNIDILVELLNEYELLVSLNAKNALELLNENKIDLILLDIMMPDMDGLEMAEIIKNNPKLKDIPILFISAKQDEESIEKGFKIGGQDYITKPFKPLELCARVKTHLNLYDSMKKLDYAANYDFLSGARNRRSFFEISKEYFPNDNLFAVMLDIDKFKSINDTYGHSIGDIVIKRLSDTIKEHINDDSMLFARMGGEEFAILCLCDCKDKIFEWTDNLRKNIDSLPVQTDEGILTFSISCGIAKYEEDMKSVDYLLNEADIALYEAKNTGRNRTIFRIKESKQ